MKYRILLFLVALFFYPFQAQTKPLKVVVFLHTECPISQKVTLSLNEIREQFTNENIEWKAYFTDKKISKKEIENFRLKYNFTWECKKDKHLRLSKKTGASITPEVFLLADNQSIIYQGAIDNWFYEWGKNRLKPTEFYLKNAIENTLRHQAVSPKKTEAIGCWIEF